MATYLNSGVYCIEHTATGRCYIGSSVELRTRKRKHLTALRKGVHHSRYLQAAWNKYGEDAFIIRTMLVCDRVDVRFYEQRLLDGLSPAFNMAKSATSPIHTGQKLAAEHAAKVADAIRARYAAGFTIAHPPRTQEYREYVGQAASARWNDPAHRAKNTAAIAAAMTPDECAARSSRTTKLWADPEYRKRAIASRVGKPYNKGYKCTPAQIENRRKAARISNTKRAHGANWRAEYAKRYPEYIGDLDAK